MIWYADASFLVSAFGVDANTNKAKHWLKRCQHFPLIVTRLSLLEADTALRAAVVGGRLSVENMTMALEGIHRATLEGHMLRREVPARQWFPQAHRITAHASTEAVCRALDVLHIAAAIVLKTKGFLTFDGHQKLLAKTEGLIVAP